VLDGSVGRVGDPPGNRSLGQWIVRDLLSDVVVRGEVQPPKSFSLAFQSDRRLIVFDDSSEFESFAIQPGDFFV
jgi:hypothetical protein